MSQKMARKVTVAIVAMTEEKEKRQTDSPVKDMKKKVAANAEKDKQAADKSTDKPADKPKQVDKVDKPKQPEKVDNVEKPKQPEKDKVEKPKQPQNEKVETPKTKQPEKPEKPKTAEKTPDKPAEKAAEKNADQKNGVDNKPAEAKEKKDDAAAKNVKEARKSERSKQNGSKQNGDSNGVDEPSSEDEEFPELAYDDNSDHEGGQHSRSATRRDQVKVTRTPETPQPAASDEAKDPKTKKEEVSDRKLRSSDSPPRKEDVSDRKLRSSDSPRPDKKEIAKESNKDGDKKGDEVIIVVETEGGESRKTDTNFSKCRVKVSPYRRSVRRDRDREPEHDDLSVCANYTGNNSTMEMDITEGENPDDSYLSSLRRVKGRRSYRPLSQLSSSLPLRSPRKSDRVIPIEHSTRPTGTVVGRKRKPDGDNYNPTSGTDVVGGDIAANAVGGKRMRLLARLTMPFRRTNAEIVGINSDLPLSAEGVSFDPETLKASSPTTEVASEAIETSPPVGNVVQNVAAQDRRCIVM